MSAEAQDRVLAPWMSPTIRRPLSWWWGRIAASHAREWLLVNSAYGDRKWLGAADEAVVLVEVERKLAQLARAGVRAVEVF